MAQRRITSELWLEMIQVAPDLFEEGKVRLIPRIKAWQSLVQLERNRWFPLNAADIYMCGLDHDIVKKREDGHTIGVPRQSRQSERGSNG